MPGIEDDLAGRSPQCEVSGNYPHSGICTCGKENRELRERIRELEAMAKVPEIDDRTAARLRGSDIKKLDEVNRVLNSASETILGTVRDAYLNESRVKIWQALDNFYIGLTKQNPPKQK